MSLLSDTRAMVTKESLLLLRDRHAVMVLFVMPAVFILFLSMALANVYDDKVGASLTVMLVVEDEQPLARTVARNLRARSEMRYVEPVPGLSPEQAVKDGLAKVVILIPEGFSDDLAQYMEDEGLADFGSHRIVWRADPTLDASYLWFVEASAVLAVLETIFDDLTVGLDDLEQEDSEQLRAGFVERAPGDASEIIPTPLQQTVPGWSLFAMFFIAVPLSTSFIRERLDGTLDRVLTYPVSHSTVVLGKLLPYFVINLVQFALMLLVGTVVVPLLGDLELQLGAHPLHLIPVTLAAATAATGYGALLAAVARTAEQANAFGTISIITMAVVGGVMVPHFVMPLFMQKLAYLSPLYWGHQAYLDVLLRGLPLTEMADKLVVLGAFGLACFIIAALRVRVR